MTEILGSDKSVLEFKGNQTTTPERLWRYFDEFLELADECLSVVGHANQAGNLISGECSVRHTIPNGCTLEVSELMGKPVDSQVYRELIPGHLVPLGEHFIHGKSDAFLARSAEVKVAKRSDVLILSEDVFESNDPEKRGRRVLVSFPAGEKHDQVAEISEVYLQIKLNEFVALANEAYKLESRFTDNHDELTSGQVNIHFIMPDGWVMNCYTKPGSGLSHMSVAQTDSANIGHKYLAQYSPSNPFVAEWMMSDSIPGYGMWHEEYVIRQKDGNGPQIHIAPQDLGDVVVEFVKV